MPKRNINRFCVGGNLTADPELKWLSNGTPVVRFRIASTDARKKDGEWVEAPNYFTIRAYGTQAEACEKWLEKGSPVIVDGRMRWSEWKPEGADAMRENYEVIADVVQFLPRAGSSAPDASEAPSSGPAAASSPEVDIPFARPRIPNREMRRRDLFVGDHWT